MKIWFQNRRTKWKKQENGTSEQTDGDYKRKIDEDESVSHKKRTIISLNNNSKTESNHETKKILTVKDPSSFLNDQSLQVT